MLPLGRFDVGDMHHLTKPAVRVDHPDKPLLGADLIDECRGVTLSNAAEEVDSFPGTPRMS
ncbi:hypothetical protein GCM10023081_00770 [Arthrobacter ginkgonis]|uniref:Uncharacterized protein n=1 Tax=Arthrobacter ginkgonis TaxID=1630594 RepID=A0ABP7BNC9_9MICC